MQGDSKWERWHLCGWTGRLQPGGEAADQLWWFLRDSAQLQGDSLQVSHGFGTLHNGTCITLNAPIISRIWYEYCLSGARVSWESIRPSSGWRWAWTRAAGRWSSRCGTIFVPQHASARGVTGSTYNYSCCITDAEPEHALPGGEAAGAGPSPRHSPPRPAGWQVVLILTHAVSLTLSLNTCCRAVKQQVRDHLRATARLGPQGDRYY